MTTIAFDGNVLATDTQVTCGGIVVGNHEKIHQLPDSSFVALAGDHDCIYQFLDWMKGGDKPVFTEKAAFQALHFSNGTVTEYTCSTNGYPAMTPCAIGSGSQIALTAMKCGKNAIDAVKVACEMDIYSGGEVTHVVINPYDH